MLTGIYLISLLSYIYRYILFRILGTFVLPWTVNIFGDISFQLLCKPKIKFYVVLPASVDSTFSDETGHRHQGPVLQIHAD